MREIVSRPIEWNKQRYDQVYSHTLAGDLVYEEYMEFLQAEELVDQLDALCDLHFVLIGVLWKLKANPEELLDMSVLDILEWYKAVTLDAAFEKLVNSFLEAEYNDKAPQRVIAFAVKLLEITWGAAHCRLNLTANQFKKAILVVCDSNDSKSVAKVKTDPSIKANKDKGSTFIAPEPRLQLILDEVRDEH